MRFFITHIAPKNALMEYDIPAAPIYFSYNLISGKMFDKVYSILPANIRTYKHSKIDKNIEIIFSVLRGKSIFHKIAPFFEDLEIYFKIPRHSSVWFYNINMLTAFLVILLRIFKPSVKLYTIILDYTPGAKWSNILIKLINSSDGIISLSTSNLFTVKNKKILPGVVPENQDFAKITNISNNFLLSGNLNEQISLLHMVLPAFSKLEHCTLHITGFSGDQEYIKSYTDKFANIINYGMLDYSSFCNLVQKCTFLLSTRDPNYPENMCNFPSKVIEGLLYNRIIISTIKYIQLKDIKYFICPSNEKKFVNFIHKLTTRPVEILEEYANQSNKVIEEFSCKVWSNYIIEIENNA